VRIRVHPGRAVGGEAAVPGDKSIAHRWLILAATARGRSALSDLPVALDVRSTACCLAQVSPPARPSLEAWASRASERAETDGFTWDGNGAGSARSEVVVEAEGRSALREPSSSLDCGNSGTTMRLLLGVLAGAPFGAVLTGDDSLRSRPMERVAAPLREMGAGVRTADGHAPVEIAGGSLHGIRHAPSVPSAQVKGAVLLAGIAASGETTVVESATTRDHTERALAHLGAPVRVERERITVSAFQHEGFEGSVPGDVSSAAFLVAAAALTGAGLVVRGVGLNPSRTHYLDVMRRMGVRIELRLATEELGEPVGDLVVGPCTGLTGTTVEERELPLVIDEVPVLAALAAHAIGETRFARAGELRVKESDRLSGIAEAVRSLGGQAGVGGDDLIVAGGGLAGGSVDPRGDHRMAMAAAVAALAASGDCVIEGMEAAEVSFPGFSGMLRALGAGLEG
jgi:3-phosphoshikimate 1-carboxyvinyltransferase